MRKSVVYFRTLALLLAVIMLFGAAPLAVFAEEPFGGEQYEPEEDDLYYGTVELAGFEPIQGRYYFESGSITLYELAAEILPQSLEAFDADGNNHTVGISWSWEDFNAESEYYDEYIFTVVLNPGYELLPGVEIPEVTVAVYAEEEDPEETFFAPFEEEMEPFATVTVTDFAGLQSAVNAFNTNATEDTTIIIGADFAITSAISISNEDYEMTIKGNATDRVLTRGEEDIALFEVSDGKLILEDIIIDGRKEIYENNDESLVNIWDSGELELNDGAVLRNNHAHASSGGGIYNNGTITMSGGEISGNVSEWSGGGIYNNGTITMSGGEISGNSITTEWRSGGGVYISGGEFTMTGGEITENSASSGGGVYISGGEFTMTGGEITENSASSNGGGIYVSSGEFTMTGGEIIDNRLTYNYGFGAGVYSSGTLFFGATAVIKGNYRGEDSSAILSNVGLSSNKCIILETDATAPVSGMEVWVSPGNSNGVFVDSGAASDHVQYFRADGAGKSIVYYDGKLAAIIDPPTSGPFAQLAEFANAANDMIIVLDKDVTVTEVISIPANIYGKTLTIKSANASSPRTITRGFTDINSGSGLFVVNDGVKLILEDIIIDGNKTAHPGNNSLIRVNDGGELTIENGVILRNNNGSFGGAVSNYGKLTMNGGTITGNISGNYGGGVYNYTSGIFTMAGGDIINNSASEGGGVYNYFGVYTLNGGTISGNIANGMQSTGGGIKSGTGHGGGVYNYLENGSFIMTGGTIESNNAVASGGGVYVFAYSNAYTGGFEFAGGRISDNSAALGGGVAVSGGALEISGGEISGNTAYNSGGGLYNDSSTNGGVVNISGGEITGNTASIFGGGIYSLKTLTVTGGEISDNMAYGSGGGIYAGAGNITLGGTAVVKDNIRVTKGTAEYGNIYLPFGVYLTLGTGADSPVSGMEVWVTKTADDGVIAESGGTETYAGYFFADDETKAVYHNGGKLVIGLRPQTLSEAKTAAEAVLAGYECTNDTTASDIMALVTGAITNEGITATWQTAFALDPAVSGNEGVVTGIIRLTLYAEYEDIVIAKTIQIKLEKITISKKNLELTAGETETLTYTLTPADTTQTELIWESNNPDVATVDTAGMVTAVKPGSATIIVMSQKNPQKYDYCFVTVKADTTGEVPVVGIDSVPAGLIVNGRIIDDLYISGSDSIKKSITLKSSNGTEVTWRSSDSKVAAIDAAGKVNYVSTGTTIITAVVKNGINKGEIEWIVLTVRDITPKLPVTAITLNSKTDGTKFEILPSDNFSFNGVKLIKAMIGKDDTAAGGFILTQESPTEYRLAANTMNIPKNGKYTLTLQAVDGSDDPVGAQFTLTVTVVNTIPKATVKLPQLNTFWKQAEGQITISGKDIPGIVKVELRDSPNALDSKGKLKDGYVTNNFTVSADGIISAKETFGSYTDAKGSKPAVKGILRIYYEGYGDNYYETGITVPIKETAPKLSVTPTTQTLSKNSGNTAKVEISGGRAESVTYADIKANAGINTVMCANNILTITLKPGAPATNKLQIEVRLVGARKTITVKPTIKTATASAVYKLSASSVTLNSAYQNQSVLIMITSSLSNVTIPDMTITPTTSGPVSGNVKVEQDSGVKTLITISIDKGTTAGSYKYSVKPSDGKAMTLTVKVDGKESGVTVSVKADKNKIDLVDAKNTKFVYTPTLKGTTSKITGVTAALTNFDVIWNAESGKVEVTAKPGVTYQKGESYKTRFEFTLDSGDTVSTGDVTIKPAQSKVKHNIPKTTIMFQSRTGAGNYKVIDLKATNPAGAKISGIGFKAEKTDKDGKIVKYQNNPNDAYWYFFDYDSQQLHIWIKDSSLVKPGKATLTFSVLYEGQGSEKDMSVKPFDLKIPLTVLK